MKTNKKRICAIATAVTLLPLTTYANIFGNNIESINDDVMEILPYVLVIIFIVGAVMGIAKIGDKGVGHLVGYMISYILILSVFYSIVSYILTGSFV